MADSLLEDNQASPDERQALLEKWKDKSKEEILEAKINSDIFIKTQNARFDDIKADYLKLRQEQQASADLQTLLDQIKKERMSPDTNPITQETVQPAIKSEDIEALVNKQIAEKLTLHQQQLKQHENLQAMQTKLKERLGPNYQEVYKQRLDQLGLSKEFADDLAKNHPTVFLKTFELDAVPVNTPSQAPPRSQVRQTQFTSPVQKRDWNYYQEMKKSNPKLYLDPKIAIQMHDDAIALGDSFGLPQE